MRTSVTQWERVDRAFMSCAPTCGACEVCEWVCTYVYGGNVVRADLPVLNGVPHGVAGDLVGAARDEFAPLEVEAVGGVFPHHLAGGRGGGTREGALVGESLRFQASRVWRTWGVGVGVGVSVVNDRRTRRPEGGGRRNRRTGAHQRGSLSVVGEEVVHVFVVDLETRYAQRVLLGRGDV